MFYFSEVLEKPPAHRLNEVYDDPGCGFSKTVSQNFELLGQFQLFKTLQRVLLAGVSRKSMIYKTLGTSPQNALNGTTALHMVALNKGANILRVHDVKEALECIQLHLALKKEDESPTER